MKKTFFAIVFLVFCLKSNAQNLFQDASGESNIYLPGKDPFGWIRFNSSDQSVSLGYNHTRSVGNDFTNRKTPWSFFGGGDFKVNSKNGIANIFKSDQLSTGLAFNGNLGINTYNLSGKNNYSSIYLRGGITYDNLIYIHGSNSAVIIDKPNKVTGKILANFNYQFNLAHIRPGIDTTETYLFIGFSTGYSKVSNYSDLNDITASNIQYGNPGTITATTIVTGKNGLYQAYNTVPINFDIGYIPRLFKTNTIGFNSYFRTNIFKQQNTANAGIGLFISKKDNPSNIIGGLAWQFNDIGNTLNRIGTLTQRSSVFFYVGYTISGGK